jgi:DNA-binding MarR family transcriptional regulator
MTAAPSVRPTPSSRVPVDLMMLLTEASHALTTELAAELADIGITPREYCVLAKAEGADMTQREIAARAGIDKTTMVVTVDQLERAGLAQRLADPTDRRARIVGITAEGRKVLARADAAVTGIYDDVLGTLPVDERAGMVAALQRLVEGDGRLSTPLSGQGVRRARAKNLPT